MTDHVQAPRRSPVLGAALLSLTLSQGCASHTVTLTAPTADVPVMLSPSGPDLAAPTDEEERAVSLRYVSGMWVIPLPGGAATSVTNVAEDTDSKLDESIADWTDLDPDAWLQVDAIVLNNWAAYGLLYLRETHTIRLRSHLVTDIP